MTLNKDNDTFKQKKSDSETVADKQIFRLCNIFFFKKK